PMSEPRTGGNGMRPLAKHGISADAPVVLVLSRLHRKKGLERLFTAVATLSVDHPQLVLLIAGSGKARYEAELRQKAEASAGNARVVWLGMAVGPDRWDASAAATVFVMPSEHEHFGIVV